MDVLGAMTAEYAFLGGGNWKALNGGWLCPNRFTLPRTVDVIPLTKMLQFVPYCEPGTHQHAVTFAQLALTATTAPVHSVHSCIVRRIYIYIPGAWH